MTTLIRCGICSLKENKKFSRQNLPERLCETNNYEKARKLFRSSDPMA